MHEAFLTRLAAAFEAARDPERAVAMRAYMRDQFPFLGIGAPAQKTLVRAALTGLGAPTGDDLRALALACWDLPEREYQYAACFVLRRFVKRCPAGFLPTARTLITTKSWWDSVDALAAHTVGPLVAAHPELGEVMDRWITDDNLWVARTALLHQLRYGAATNEERLFAYCVKQSGHRDFFIRKAIGWALREYARTDPEAVRAFVARTPLSPLSVREAMKHMNLGAKPHR
ncbi:DNA alkylation repair protein [Luedemannella flava]|uniref:DNA alkylation repair protein n=1 Tax=Luedemannella flava TaxID=349316 RepID=A0ABN2LKA8_9ACTN